MRLFSKIKQNIEMTNRIANQKSEHSKSPAKETKLDDPYHIDYDYDGKLSVDLRKKGWEFKGKQSGYYYYNDPKTGSTLMFNEDMSKKDINKKIENSRSSGDFPSVPDDPDYKEDNKNSDEPNIEDYYNGY